MKLSKYNVITEYDKENYAIANLLTGCLGFVSKEDYNSIKCNENRQIINYDCIATYKCELVNDLLECGFIINDTDDELSIIKDMYWKTKLNKEVLNITIVPSFRCNLKCKYCYQQEFNQNKIISKQTLENIYLFIKKKLNEDLRIKQININWFGGEVLTCIDTIESFGIRVKKLCEDKNIKHIASIITNGYLLNQKNIYRLKNMGVEDVSITIAGFREEHDFLRPTKYGNPTFDKIMENLKLAQKNFDKIVLVNNVSSYNIKNMKYLFDYLKSNNLYGNVYIVFKRIETFGLDYLQYLCLSKEEYNKVVFDFSMYALDLGLTLGGMSKFIPNFMYCYGTYDNAFAVDFNSNIYKCIEKYDEHTRIGYIDNYGNIIRDNVSYYSIHENFDLFKDQKCVNCKILPYCMGGCASKRASCKNCCPDDLDCIEDSLKIYAKNMFINKI